MRLIHRSILLLFLFCSTLRAQLPISCNGTASAIACETTCISCNFNGFSGSTEGYPSGIAPEFCGTVENVQWLGFIAGATQATFVITPSNCVNGDGVQVALYTDCNLPPIACDKGEMNGAGMPVSISTPLTLGANYYLLVDGYAGDQCSFTVSVSPSDAVFQPPLGTAQVITGPAAMCPNSTARFLVQPVVGAAAYIWTGPPGTLFDSLPSPATILGNDGLEVEVIIGSVGGKICVQAANACETNQPCAASVDLLVLDDSFRPKITTDTLTSLTCTGDPLPLNVKIIPNANIDLVWTLTDSVGHFVGNPNSIRALVDSIGSYSLLVTDWTNGCTSTASIRVTDPELPAGATTAIRHVTCYDLSNGKIGVDTVLSGTPPYLYSFDNHALTIIPEANNLPAGEHALLIQDALGCEWDTVFVLQQPDELLVALFSDTTINLGESLVLWDSSVVNYPARPVRWNLTIPEMGDTIHCAGCPAMPVHSFRFVLMVNDSNGCKASDIRQVTVMNNHHVYFPNIFKPGISESVNERFGPFCGDDVTGIPLFLVLDRWGQVVHERTDAAPNDYTTYWDGNIRSRPGNPGVYIYLAEVRFKNGEVLKYRGDITLLR
jgi:hypothetical protein